MFYCSLIIVNFVKIEKSKNAKIFKKTVDIIYTIVYNIYIYIYITLWRIWMMKTKKFLFVLVVGVLLAMTLSMLASAAEVSIKSYYLLPSGSNVITGKTLGTYDHEGEEQKWTVTVIPKNYSGEELEVVEAEAYCCHYKGSLFSKPKDTIQIKRTPEHPTGCIADVLGAPKNYAETSVAYGSTASSIATIKNNAGYCTYHIYFGSLN